MIAAQFTKHSVFDDAGMGVAERDCPMMAWPSERGRRVRKSLQSLDEHHITESRSTTRHVDRRDTVCCLLIDHDDNGRSAHSVGAHRKTAVVGKNRTYRLEAPSPVLHLGSLWLGALPSVSNEDAFAERPFSPDTQLSSTAKLLEEETTKRTRRTCE